LLITNDRKVSATELLAAYQGRPHLEKRHAQLTGTQPIAPVWLHDPARIEGLLCCHFIAMLIQALIEREIRRAMTAAGLRHLSLNPEDRGRHAPSAARVLEIFSGVAHHHLLRAGLLIETLHPRLSPPQRQVLDLLDIPHTVYTTA